jgi:hypothetical protein
MWLKAAPADDSRRLLITCAVGRLPSTRLLLEAATWESRLGRLADPHLPPRRDLELLLGVEMKIPYYRIDSQHRVLSDPRWHLHHNAVLRIGIADLNLDLLPTTVGRTDPALKDFRIYNLSFGETLERKARFACRAHMAPVHVGWCGENTARRGEKTLR